MMRETHHNFALFRAAALLFPASDPEQESDRVVNLQADRHQSAFETYAVALWVLATANAYTAVWLFGGRHPAVALAAAFIPSLFIVQVPSYVMGTVVMPPIRAVTGTRGADNLRVNSTVLMLLMIAASLYFARSEHWVRFVAWQFLGFVALDAVVAAVLFVVKGGRRSAR